MDIEHEKFMRLALAEAQQALAANDFPVGCILVRGGAIIGRGRRVNSRSSSANELDHAEMKALRGLADRQPLPDRTGITAYCTMEPCLMCFAALLLNGIRTIVYAYEDVMGGGTGLDLTRITPLYRELEVAVIPAVLRQESLALFHDFFSSPDNGYWQGSYLARYTLDQLNGK
jgi:tRNA(adenine34) deaminase